MVTVLVTAFWLVLIFLGALFLHELGHLLVAKLAGIGILHFAIGNPSGEPKLKFRLFGVPWLVFGLPTMFVIGANGDDYLRARGWIKAAYVLAGPVANLITALMLATTASGFVRGSEFVRGMIQFQLTLLGEFFLGWLRFSPSETFAAGTTPISVMAGDAGITETILIFAIFLHLFMFIANLAPLPGMDGGWLVMQLEISIKASRSRDFLTTGREVMVHWSNFAKRWLVKIVVGLTLFSFTVNLVLKLIFKAP